MPTFSEAKQAAEQGHLQQARLMYEAILQENSRSVESWLGLAEVLTETEDKRVCYDNVLKIDKKNQVAKDGLRNLEPQTDQLRQMFDIAPGETQQPIESSLEEDEEEDEETQESPSKSKVKAKPTKSRAKTKKGKADSANETSMVVLVAIGFALSIVVFGLISVVIFIGLNSFAGG